MDGTANRKAEPGLKYYPYKTLRNPKSLRLLKLMSGSERTADLNCELFENDSNKPTAYEALSWTWATAGETVPIRIIHGDETFSFQAPKSLDAALRALRFNDRIRVLWIDYICINQEDINEKNHQIPMMAQIFGEATQVCIWLGEPKDNSKMAIDFIKTHVLDLWNFDKLCENKDMSTHWAALLQLIMRPWFSRRWVVQEIALANSGLIYCGRDTITWRKFADAVSLFVEVETATHRLSEIMKREEIFNHIPDFFENVANLSATLLIETVDNLFRRTQDGEKDRLLSLEYLVSNLSVFKSSEPRDIIYALLAIARDTTPRAASRVESGLPASQELSALGRSILSKPYDVDYKKPYIEIYKDFISFSIRQSDQTRALDIICRPWAHPIDGPASSPLDTTSDDHSINVEETFTLPSWIQSVGRAAFQVNETPLGDKMHRINADALVGSPTVGHRNYSAAGTKAVSRSKLRFAKRSGYYSMFVEGFVLDQVEEVYELTLTGSVPKSWLEAGGWRNFDLDPPEEFWRTMVANRGPAGHNPPAFYPTACREAVKKGMRGEAIDSAWLILHGKCSIVAQFLRRVQAVIWNRRMIRTQSSANVKFGRLGMAPKTAKQGDLVCILYGCSVPVILRKVQKSQIQIIKERQEEEPTLRLEAAIKIQRNWRAKQERKAERRKWAKALGEQHRIQPPEMTAQHTNTLQMKSDNPSNGYLNRLKKWKNRYRIESEVMWTRLKIRFKLLLRKYQILSAYLIPIYGSILVKVIREGRLNANMLYMLLLSVAIIILLPRSMVMRLWSVCVENWYALLSSMNLRSRNTYTVNDYYFEFIGESYIHGMMDGEAIRYQNENEKRPQIFELR